VTLPTRQIDGDQPLCVLYITSRYPAVSHSFIATEIRSLRRTGKLEVRVVGLRESRPSDLLDEDALNAYQEAGAVRPTRLRDIARAQFSLLARSPHGFFRSLRYALQGTRRPTRLVRRLGYFVQASVILDRYIDESTTHVHAHFEQPAADVARLVAFTATMTGESRALTWSFTAHSPYAYNASEVALKIRDCDAVVCVSDRGEKYLTELAADDAQRRKIHLIRCGIEPARFTVAAEPASAGSVRVLSVARLEPGKGHHVLLRALAQLSNPRITLALVGDGSARSDLERLTRELGLTSAVTFCGNRSQSDLPAIYAAADIFCLPSFSEGVPVVIMEAFTAGLPVIATDVGGVSEIVSHRKSGLLVPAGDVDALAAALVEMLQLQDKWSGMAHQGKLTVLRNYDSVTNARALASLFEQLAAPRTTTTAR